MQTSQQTVKGITRAYRKSLRRAGYRNFPLTGAFVALNSRGKILLPLEIKRGLKLNYPTMALADVLPSTLSSVYNAAPTPDLPAPLPSPLPALPVAYRRTEKVSATTGRTRAIYTIVPNPKPTQRVWTKQGRKYVQVTYASLLSDRVA